MYPVISERLIVVILVLFRHNVTSTVTTCGSCDLVGPLPQFDDKKVWDFPLRIVLGLEALWECTRRCWDDHRCRSYSYNSLTRVCATFAVSYSDPGNTYNAVTTETGWKLYPVCGRTESFGTKCSADNECNYDNGFCKDGRCECSLGYSFNPNSDSCVTRCTAYGDAFVEFQDHAIGSMNTIELSSVESAEECIDLCKAETTIFCANAEYRSANLRCNLVNVTWYEVDPAQRLAISGWSFFNRHCAINT